MIAASCNSIRVPMAPTDWQPTVADISRGTLSLWQAAKHDVALELKFRQSIRHAFWGCGSDQRDGQFSAGAYVNVLHAEAC